MQYDVDENDPLYREIAATMCRMAKEDAARVAGALSGLGYDGAKAGHEPRTVSWVVVFLLIIRLRLAEWAALGLFELLPFQAKTYGMLLAQKEGGEEIPPSWCVAALFDDVMAYRCELAVMTGNFVCAGDLAGAMAPNVIASSTMPVIDKVLAAPVSYKDFDLLLRKPLLPLDGDATGVAEVLPNKRATRQRNHTGPIDMAKLLMPEKEVAALLSCSTESLAQRRRRGEIPRRFYRQDRKGGKVRYYTELVNELIKGDTVSVRHNRKAKEKRE